MSSVMSPIIDLHSHSTCSDGVLDPESLVIRAFQKGVSHFALTDHDTMSGIDLAAKTAKQHDIKFYSGIELSCVWAGMTIHILGLGFDTFSEVMTKACDDQKNARANRAEIIDERLRHKCKMTGVLELAREHSGHDVPGRPHFAEAMVELGYVANTSVAFSQYLGSGKLGDVKSLWPDLQTVVEWVTAAGGVAVIAHPRKYKMTTSKLRRLIVDFIAAGGQAIEVVTSGQKQGDTGLLVELCRQYELLASLGSDFHFPGANWCELGRNLPIPAGVDLVCNHIQPMPVIYKKLPIEISSF
ncbi:MAG: phosphatase [Gammaproteobacteria bacterium]|nr:MAG: phosphatase [Gammaproteobacteria bacterium]